MGISITDLPPKAQAQAIRKLMAEEARKAKRERKNHHPAPLAKGQERKGTKYHNIPTERVTPEGGVIKFDSAKEARRYDELMALLDAGRIRDLKLQKQFTLQEAYTTTEGVRVRAIRYVADFCYEAMRPYWHPYMDQCPPEGWYEVVEDVKSRATKTRQYEIKKKLMAEKFHITIREV